MVDQAVVRAITSEVRRCEPWSWRSRFTGAHRWNGRPQWARHGDGGLAHASVANGQPIRAHVRRWIERTKRWKRAMTRKETNHYAVVAMDNGLNKVS